MLFNFIWLPVNKCTWINVFSQWKQSWQFYPASFCLEMLWTQMNSFHGMTQKITWMLAQWFLTWGSWSPRIVTINHGIRHQSRKYFKKFCTKSLKHHFQMISFALLLQQTSFTSSDLKLNRIVWHFAESPYLFLITLLLRGRWGDWCWIDK